MFKIKYNPFEFIDDFDDSIDTIKHQSKKMYHNRLSEKEKKLLNVIDNSNKTQLNNLNSKNKKIILKNLNKIWNKFERLPLEQVGGNGIGLDDIKKIFNIPFEIDGTSYELPIYNKEELFYVDTDTINIMGPRPLPSRPPIMPLPPPLPEFSLLIPSASLSTFSKSQTMHVLSLEADTNRPPSGDKAKWLTESRWPVNVYIIRLLLVSISLKKKKIENRLSKTQKA
jgi:hypothetical protein